MIARFCRLDLVAALMLAVTATAQAAEPKAFGAGSWAAIRQAHQGQPLIVHFWGLTCAPCRTEMPEWGRLIAEDPTTPIVFVHAERPPSKPEAMTTFIASSGLAATDTWYFADRFLEPLRFEIDPGWHGELPMTLLIGRDGEVKTIIGSASSDDIMLWLRNDGRAR